MEASKFPRVGDKVTIDYDGEELPKTPRGGWAVERVEYRREPKIGDWAEFSDHWWQVRRMNLVDYARSTALEITLRRADGEDSMTLHPVPGGGYVYGIRGLEFCDVPPVDTGKGLEQFPIVGDWTSKVESGQPVLLQVTEVNEAKRWVCCEKRAPAAVGDGVRMAIWKDAAWRWADDTMAHFIHSQESGWKFDLAWKATRLKDVHEVLLGKYYEASEAENWPMATEHAHTLFQIETGLPYDADDEHTVWLYEQFTEGLNER